MKLIRIIKIQDTQKRRAKDFISEEMPLRIEVKGKEIAALFCSPFALKELVIGFLYTTGFITGLSGIKKIAVSREDKVARVEFKLAGRGRKVVPDKDLVLNAENQKARIIVSEDFKLKPGEILLLMQQFQHSSGEFKKTGGVHSAALCSNKKILIFRDDLGRHNAIDKVIGRALLEKIGFADKLILTSGRVPLEILLKILKCKIPVTASLGAPTHQAVKIARQTGITLIGFARGSSLNVYSGEKRIK